ncbi:deleted in malignant brain tumors 1 protein-like [Ruditapes philippinarum]|uniref:deleted in malignant brain tumors 1 protein-like n=1 Tax=Ruditapes philippinarum TaxID=129788 RepID=UPI00295AA041|nr:deleted in malignant brain tumors 1 protein-like [Ruditapes philippinarum]
MQEVRHNIRIVSYLLRQSKLAMIMFDLTYLKRIFNVFLSGLFIYHEVSSQCDDTGPLVLQSSTFPQYFTSPNYPSNYHPNSNCSWRIEAPTVGEKIIINIEDFKVEGTSTDYLNVYDSSDDSTTPVTTLSESNAGSFNVFVSTTSTLYITFISNDVDESQGFRILFFTNNPDNQAACGTTLTVTSEEQVFMSPNLPQPYNASVCSWTFSSSASIVFQLKFLDMGGCLQSHITFYDGPSESDTELKSLCHTARTYTFDNIKTTGSGGHIVYRVTDQPMDYYGFVLVYSENQGNVVVTLYYFYIVLD